MPNPQQNQVQNEIEQFKREINLLQDMLKQSLKKKQSLLQNGQKGIAKMYNKIQNETKQIKRKINLL